MSIVCNLLCTWVLHLNVFTLKAIVKQEIILFILLKKEHTDFDRYRLSDQKHTDIETYRPRNKNEIEEFTVDYK